MTGRQQTSGSRLGLYCRLLSLMSLTSSPAMVFLPPRRFVTMYMVREDALPKVPEKMSVRTARHVYLYVKTPRMREGRLED